MSDFLAEARILVRPDTSGFRALLEAELRAVTATPIAIPIAPIATGTAAGLTGLEALTTQLTASTVQLTAATEALVVAMNQEAVSAGRATKAQTAHSASLNQLARGAGSSGLTLFGLRGATLAASGAFLAGTAAVVAFSKAVGSAASLETQLNVFEITAGATADQMERISTAAQALGRDITLPGVGAGDAAQAMTELAKAGLSVEDSLNAARGTLQLATAAQIDNVEATGLVAGALNAFGLAGTQAVKVADLLTGAAQESQGSISDMGTALGQAAAVSKQFGVSIEDTVTLLTQVAQAGIAGGRAGTSYRVALLRLVNPSADAARELAKLNVSIRDVNGNLRPQVFTDIAVAMEGYTKAQRDAALATIFGSDAIRFAAITGARGAAAFEATRAAITEQGLAAATAGARTKGLEGDFESLKNQVEALGVTLGQAASKPTSLLVRGLTRIADAANELAESFFDTGPSFDVVNANIEELIQQAGRLEDRTKDFHLLGDFAKDPIREELQGVIAEILRVGDSLEVGSAKFDVLMHAFATQLPAVEKALKDGIVDGAEQAELALTELGRAFLKVIPTELLQETALNDGVNTGLAFAEGLRSGMVSQKLSVGATARSLIEDATRAAAQGIQTAPPVVDPGLGEDQIKGILARFDAKEVRSRIEDDDKELLALLKEEQDFLEKQLQRQSVQRRQTLKRVLEGVLLGTVNDIRTIQDQAKSEAEALRRDAKKAADEAAAAVAAGEQALLAGFGLARDQQQNDIAKAALKAGLADDVREQQELRGIVLDQIAEVKKRITIEGGRLAALAALDAILTQVKASLLTLRKQERETQQAQRDALLQGINLDIEFAEVTENRAKEIAGRERLIAQLRKDQKLVKAGTNEWKRLRNLIEQETAAINEIKGAKKEQNNAFATASFEFLQSQQGFASSLLGNLIPSGATGGLVGGGQQAPVQAALQPVAGAAEARSMSGPTAGQGNQTNQFLFQILEQLKQLNGETKAPEATWQRRVQYSVMDGAPLG